MFEFLKGIIVEKSDKAIILDVKDIGYKIFVPLSFNSPIKEKILIYISMIIKD